MIKKSIYPKTKRLGKENSVITITEKLDGSNLAFFKKDGGGSYSYEKQYIKS